MATLLRRSRPSCESEILKLTPLPPLSGAPLRARATEVVRFITARSPLPVIAVGGIMSADDALEKFDAGAALVQLYTGFIYEGPGLVRSICEALVR